MNKPIEDIRNEYIAATAADDKAAMRRLQSQLVTENMNLVRQLVRKCLKRAASMPEVEHVELEDLEQAGVLGMLRAFETFTPGKAKFSTYAFFWIRREVQKALGHAQDIRKPTTSAKPSPVNRVQNRIRTLHGREATVEEINRDFAEVLRVTRPKSTERDREKSLVTEDKLDNWRKSDRMASMDEFTTEGLGHGSQGIGNVVTLHDITADAGPGPEKQMQNREMAEAIANGIQKLKGAEADVLYKIFYQGMTEQAVADSLGLRRGDVATLKHAAITKLRRRVKR